MKTTRREFIRLGTIGLAVAIVNPKILLPLHPPAEIDVMSLSSTKLAELNQQLSTIYGEGIAEMFQAHLRTYDILMEQREENLRLSGFHFNT